MLNGIDLVDGFHLARWDPSTALVLRRLVKLRINDVLTTGRIAPGSRLGLMPTWWSLGTGLRGAGPLQQFRAEKSADDEMELEVELNISGYELKDTVQLQTALVLLERLASAPRDNLAASRPGSVLWQDRIDVVLEGEAPRFPVTAVDFKESGLGRDTACWRLDWSPRELEASASAALRLWINSENTSFCNAVTVASPSAEQLVVRSALKYSVACELLDLTMSQIEELRGGDFPKGTVGQVLIDLARQLFPDHELDKLHELYVSEPGAFYAHLQASVGLFEELPA